MRAKTVLSVALIIAAVGAATGLAFGISSALGRFRLFEKDVSDSFVLYIEGTSPASKLVLLQGVERFTASRDFTARLLSIVRLEAKIELSAMADTAYFVDLADASRWKVSWSPRTGRLKLSSPPPDLLPPAVRTDTIEVTTTGANILSSAVFQLKKEAEALRSDLSKDMLAQGRKALASGELRSRMAKSLESSAAAFCAAVLHVTPKTVEVSFSD